MKRKRPGTSLIVVIVIFMSVTIVSMSMLSLIAGNYKSRVMESKRIENLYASDSGLDAAYNIIAKSFDAATKYGYYQVEALKKNYGSNDGLYANQYKNIEDEINYLNSQILILENDISDLEADKIKPNSDIGQINTKIAALKNQITDYKLRIEEDNQLIQIVINEEFKWRFTDFIAPVRTTTEVAVTLKPSIEGMTFVSNVFLNGKNINFEFQTITFGIQDGEDEAPKLEAVINPDPSSLSFENVILKYPHDFPGISITPNQSYDITVTSTFMSNENVSVTGTNRKILQSKYRMLVPNYNDIFFGNYTGGLHDYLALKNKALTIGGNMVVNDAKLTVDKGEAFVQGTGDDAANERVYGKYVGGISINNSENFLINNNDNILLNNNENALFNKKETVLLNNNVITRGTFNIRDNTGVRIEGNLYARNIYGGNVDGTYSDYSTLNANKEVVIDNDLSLKATDTLIKITDFYGINDKNIYYDDSRGNIITNFNSNADSAYKARTSSSILINSCDGKESSSEVNIENIAYIMGTGHIVTAGDYQTGESTAIKGNYEAYSIPLDLAEKFIYDEPLQVLDEKNVFTKGEHFKKYWEKIKPNGVNSGGISFNSPGKIHSVGAVVYEVNGIGKVISANYTSDLESDTESDQGIITQKRKDFASKVYRFGQTATMGDYNSLGVGAVTVSSLMNLSDLPNEYNLDEAVTDNVEKAIFIKPSNELPHTTLIIQGNDVSTDKKYFDANGKEIDKKKIIKANNINAVVATVGDVIIDGTVTFNGSIIANGNLTVSGNVKINYDEEVIGRIQKQNAELFESVFGGNIISEEQSSSTGTASIDTKYNLNNFLENKLWKIIE